MTVTLSNGAIINITVGSTSGTVVINASDDVYLGGDAASVTIASSSGGNFESLAIDTDPAVTTITDDADVTNLTLTATDPAVEGGPITYTASVDNPAGTAMTVTLSNGANINIAAGASSGTVVVNASDDAYLGGDTASVTISSSSGGNFESLSVDPTPAFTTITDDSDVTNLTLTATDPVVESGAITYTASVDNPAGSAMTVTLSNGANINIAAGASSGSALVIASDDAYLGGDTASVTIVSSTGGNFESLAVDPTPAVTTITDDVDVTTVSLSGPGSVVEGAVTTDYTVSLDAPAGTNVTVSFVYSGTAVDGTDFTGVGNVVISAGSSSTSFTIKTLDDVFAESAEFFTVAISVVSGGNFEALAIGGSSSVTTVIADDDGTPQLIVNDVVVDEDSGTAVFTVTLSPVSASTVTVDYATKDGTALTGEDYTAVSGTLTFNPGESTQQIVVPISDDYLAESSEVFIVRLSDPVNATIADQDGSGIISDDADVTNLILTATDPVIEGGPITYTASVDNPAGAAMTVTLSNGATINIAASASSGTTVVTASDDAYLGGDTASVTIASSSGGNFESLAVDPTPAVTAITDDSDVTNLTLTATDPVVEGGPITYTASVDNPADTAMTVTLSNGA
ncbi:MAG: hypothetical protein GY731_08905, partial [Gammaproteobacteria bacterium]|nr:hypothetical protein [Gammaproteobacteria bacterium]